MILTANGRGNRLKIFSSIGVVVGIFITILAILGLYGATVWTTEKRYKISKFSGNHTLEAFEKLANRPESYNPSSEGKNQSSTTEDNSSPLSLELSNSKTDLTPSEGNNQSSTTEDKSSPLSLELYTSKTDFKQGEQSLAEELSLPFLYNYTGFPADFKLWLFKTGDNFVSGFIRDGRIWEPWAINFIYDRFKTLANLRSQMDAHLRVNESIRENRQWGLLDVGANIGTITVPAAQILSRFGLGSVIAVEAIPLHVVLLRKSIEQNNLHNILVIRHAVSDKPGLNLELQIDTRNRGGSSAVGDLKLPGKVDVVSAITVTIDQIYEIYPERLKNTLIWKLDVECYEGYAFAGA